MLDFSGAVLQSSVDANSNNNVFMKFNGDGTELIVFCSGNYFEIWTLSTPYDLTTATYSSYNSLSAEIDALQQAYMTDDGYHVIIYYNYKVAVYTLTTAFDMSTRGTPTINTNYHVAPNQCTGIFCENGTNLLIFDANLTVGIFSYTFDTQWDATAITAGNSNTSIDADDAFIVADSDGLTVYCFDVSSATLYTYALSTAYDPSTASLSSTDNTTFATYTDVEAFSAGITDERLIIYDNTLGKFYYFTFPTYVSFSGTVQENGTGVARTVRAHDRTSGGLVQEVTSSAVDGSFTLDELIDGDEYYLIFLDDDAGTQYNLVGYDRIVGV